MGSTQIRALPSRRNQAARRNGTTLLAFAVASLDAACGTGSSIDGNSRASSEAVASEEVARNAALTRLQVERRGMRTAWLKSTSGKSPRLDARPMGGSTDGHCSPMAKAQAARFASLTPKTSDCILETELYGAFLAREKIEYMVRFLGKPKTGFGGNQVDRDVRLSKERRTGFRLRRRAKLGLAHE